MKQILKVSLALALVAGSATAAVAQTDGGSPLGAGGGVTGSVAPLGVPGGGATGGGGNAISGAGSQGLAQARSAFLSATGAGATVTNPAGGTVTVPVAAAQALGGVLGGTPTPAQVTALTNALPGIPANASGPLVRALAAFGASANTGTLTTAVQAFNAAVNALPAGAPIPPALLAIRSALAQASR